VKGNIKGHKLEIKRTGALDGDIIVEELATETGSKFNGNCKMGDKSKSNIIDMKDPDINIDLENESQQKEKPVLKFH
jgi:cytoskeletal protein CcmA (bactofilin family)